MLRIHHARVHTLDNGLWDIRKKQSKEPVFFNTRKTGKTNTLGRKIRSRELKFCRFSVQAFQEEKQTQPQTWDRTFT